MSDTDETKRPKTLSLKKTETSTVKQSFSHGRTKAVVVEKKRTLGAPAPKAAEKPASRADKPAAPTAEAAKPAAKAAPSRGGVVLRQLSDEEKARRAAAIADARVSDAEARRHAEEDARKRAQEEVKMKAERAAAEKRKAEEDARKAAEAEARRHAEAEAARRADPKAMPVAAEAARRRPVQEEEEEAQTKKVGNKIIPVKPATPKKAGEGERRRGKLTVTRALEGDDERVRSVAAYRRHLQRVNKGHQVQQAGPAGPRDITIPETITVSELANRMARRVVDVIKVLMKNGMMATPNDVIDAIPPNWSPRNMAMWSSAWPKATCWKD